MKKKYRPKEGEPQTAKDSLCKYQKKLIPDGITRFITQDELDRECMTVEQSKALLLEKVNSYFHHS